MFNKIFVIVIVIIQVYIQELMAAHVSVNNGNLTIHVERTEAVQLIFSLKF